MFCHGSVFRFVVGLSLALTFTRIPSTCSTKAADELQHNL